MPTSSLRVGIAFCAAVCFLAIGAGRAHAIGYLVPTRPDVEPLAIRFHRVQVGVRERIAETRVEQTFRNHTGDVLEATYIFPVPEGATVSGFALWVNGRRQEGELLDAGQARSVYEQIVARMRDPGLVEHMGGNLFRARVFPIAPNSEQRLEIRFTQTLGYQGSIVHYRYPLRTSGTAARTLEDFSISADIVSRTPIRAVYSPTHAISVARPDEHRATIGFQAHGVVLEDDFDLYYSVQDGDVGLSLLTHRTPGEDGYFLAMIAPRAEISQSEIAAKEVIFVFDTSGSMAGEKIQRARAALDYMLARLNPTDRFQLVRFSTDVESLFDGGASVPASPENVARARWFVSHMVAAGGTALAPALSQALRQGRPQSAMPRMVVFLTDGMPTVGETDPGRITAEVERSASGARIYVFGVGDDVNTTFLDRLAERTHGVGDYYRDGAELERRMSAFYDRIAYPVFTDLRLSFPGLSVYDVYPRDLGHLYRGSQLLVVGRYRGEGTSQLALEGRLASERERRTVAYPVSFPAQEARNDFLPRIWATRKIGFLLDAIRMSGERPELRDEVVALARRFGIVTPYTSYLVVDDQEIPPGVTVPTPPPPALPLPQPAPMIVDGGGGGAEQQAAPSAPYGGGSARDYAPRPPPSRSPRYDGEGGGGGGGTRGAQMHARVIPSVRPPSGARAMPSVPPTVQPSEPEMEFRGTIVEPSGAAPSGATGDRGRAVASRLRTMREAERASSVGQNGRFVAGRVFRLIGGTWVDSRYQRSMRVLRIRTASPAYFALLRARPELRTVLALGERVTVALDAERAIVVDPGAPGPVGEAEVRAFLAH